jgi:hypothetical protein
LSTKNVTITVGGNVVARAGFINWIQGSNTTYTVAVNEQTDYITVTDDAAGGGGAVATDVIWDAKGDLAVGSGADTADNLAVSVTDGDVLTADAASTLGVKWATPTSGGAPTTTDYLVGTADVGLSAEIVVGTSPGGELGGTWASPTVDATHAGTTHSAATDTHIADGSAAHAASAVSVDSTTLVGIGTDVQAVFEEVDDDIAALKTPDYLVGTATATLSGEIAVGTAPGGELGGTWASPTVDATHSGSTHGAAVTTHEAASDPHTGYRLETADHTHATTGAQAGQLDHGTALTGLTDDDHTQYVLEATAQSFSIGALLVGAPPDNGVYMIWRAPFACTVTNVRAHITAGTSATVNAQVNQTSDFLASDLVDSTLNAWVDGGAVQNTSISAGDDIGVELVGTSGAVVKVNIQVDLTRTLA